MKKELCILVCLAMSALPLFAETQSIYRKSGGVVTGEVTRTKAGYSVRSKFGAVVIPYDDVAKIEKFVSAGDEYREKRSDINVDDPQDLYELAEWAYNKALYEDARQCLNEALAINKDDELSELLLEQVKAKLVALEAKKAKKAKKTRVGKSHGSKFVRVDKRHLISKKDIYKIRLMEFSKADAKGSLRVTFRNKVLDRFIAEMEGRGGFRRVKFKRTFMSWKSARKIAYILEYEPDNEDLLKDIQIESDPAFMRTFRRRVWPSLEKSCASSSCHGDSKGAGGLKLFPQSSNEYMAYTNFVILAGYKARAGRLINRSDQASSALLTYGLSQTKVNRGKHPTPVRPAFGNVRTRQYKNTLKWISDLKSPGYPDYALSYKPLIGMKLHLSGDDDLPGARVPSTKGKDSDDDDDDDEESPKRPSLTGD